MPKVKNKERLCTTAPLSMFTLESVGGTTFYNRRSDFERLIAKNVKDPIMKNFFAMPYYDSALHGLEWHVDPQFKHATRLSELAGTPQYNTAKMLLNRAISYFETLSRRVSEQEKAYFNCMLKYAKSDDIDDMVFFTGQQVIMGVWGLHALPGNNMVSSIVTDVDDTRLHRITFKVEGGTLTGNSSFMRRHGYRLHPGTDVPSVVPDDGYKFVKWSPFDPNNATVNIDMEFTALCETDATPPPLATPQPVPPAFVPTADPIPVADPVAPEIPEVYHQVEFNAGYYGTLSGAPTIIQVPNGTMLTHNQIPIVTPTQGYKFLGWDKQVNIPITQTTTFVARYEELPRLPWWKRLFTEGCLRWLLGFLLALLVLLLVSLLLSRCTPWGHHYYGGCCRHGDVIYAGGPGRAIDRIHTGGGNYIDDNGNRVPVRDISVGDDGEIIDGWADGDAVTPPIVDENGNVISPVAPEDPDNPTGTKVMGDRLNIYFEDNDADFDKFARDFHAAYPGDRYKIIGKDKNSNWIQIQIPESQRETIREELPRKITSPKFRVVDETLMNGGRQQLSASGTTGLRPQQSASYTSSQQPTPGWHLQAVHAQQAWATTKGSPEVKVAIVDDGIQLDHELFAGRITQAYNVFRCDDRLSAGQGHGTHVAGLAAGSSSRLSNGVSGIAPNCKIMPIQVFDNGQCTASSLIRGIMYALHNNADVINVSIGTACPPEIGMIVPIEIQKAIEQTQFKEAESVWNWVFSVAARQKSIIVFAAGNSDLLASSINPQLRSAATINVGAVNLDYKVTPWSNYGPTVNISAPGEGIMSAMPGNSYQMQDGTSMAAPIVTGIVALMKSVNKDLTVEQAISALKSTGRSTRGGNQCGPVAQADLAVQKVKQNS